MMQKTIGHVACLLLGLLLCCPIAGCADGASTASEPTVLQRVLRSDFDSYSNDEWGISFAYPSIFKRETRAAARQAAGEDFHQGALAVGMSFSPPGEEGERHSFFLWSMADKRRKPLTAKECADDATSAAAFLTQATGSLYRGGPWSLTDVQRTEVGSWPAIRLSMTADLDPVTGRRELFVVGMPNAVFVLDLILSDEDYAYYNAHGLIDRIVKSVRLR